MRIFLFVIGLIFVCCSSFDAKAQTILATGAPLALSTTYGTSSASTSFNVSGVGLSAGVLVSPPAGFEVSTNNTTFSNTLIVGGAGSFSSTIVYIRLSSAVNANTYGGNIVLTSNGAATTNIAMPNSVINKAPLTIAALPQPKTYGTVLMDFTGSGVYDIARAAASLKNGNTISTVTIRYISGNNSAAPTGTYTASVVPSAVTGSNGFLISNYDVTYLPADIIISPAPLTIQVTTVVKTYGSVLSNGPGVTAFTSQGLMNRETIGSFTATYSAGTAANATIGRYSNAVTASAATGGTFSPGNYIITYLKGDLVINPATITITANNQSRVYEVTNPPLTVTYSGFVNNEGTAQLTALPTVTTTAVPTSNPGTYPIIASGASATNYIFVYVDGVLTVTPAAVVPIITLSFPNTFTPNGDGTNDTWKLTALEPYPNCTVNIYNRNGALIFSSTGYRTPWDGKYKGVEVPTGTYYYIIDAHKFNVLIASGSVAVVR